MQLDLAAIDWRPITDGVMGGRSRSDCALDGTGLNFRGVLSTANGGGFASIRGRLEPPLDPFASVRLTVTGDGRRYQIRLRESETPDDVAWRAAFNTTGERQTIVLAPADFEPVIRGRRIAGLGGLSGRHAHFIGFMLTSKEEGAFSLAIHEIEIRRAGELSA
jgi:monofunctional biosynthetic peptidoglycan transglycosylase